MGFRVTESWGEGGLLIDGRILGRIREDKEKSGDKTN